MTLPLLQIQNLNISIEKTRIINHLEFSIENKGEIHILMGPNGSGKSTLTKAIVGHPDYEINGNILFNTTDQGLISLSDLSPYDRALKGIFLGFQYPVEINGITNIEFLKEMYNQHAKHNNSLKQLTSLEFEEKVRELALEVNLNPKFLYRNVNEGFSGGEKKRNELLQLLLIQPKLIILDELDSGLDINSMELTVKLLQKLAKENSSILIISHYTSFINQFYTHNFEPCIHLMQNGKIVKTGKRELLNKIEKEGFVDNQM